MHCIYAKPSEICAGTFLTAFSSYIQTLEFDPSSERTLAAGLTHASRTM